MDECKDCRRTRSRSVGTMYVGILLEDRVLTSSPTPQMGAATICLEY